MKTKPGPKPMPLKERLGIHSITTTPDEWSWCIAEARKKGFRSVASLVRSYIQKEMRKDK